MSIQQTKHKKLTVEFVRRVFKYDPVESILRWDIRGQGIPYGERAGSLANKHYSVRLFDKVIFVHVIIWFYMTGVWPKYLVDHIDGNYLNNKWVNLREATQSQNMMNTKLRVDNQTGCKGVYLHPNGTFKVIITADKKTYYLGYFKTFEEAVAPRRAAEQKYHGEFARAE